MDVIIIMQITSRAKTLDLRQPQVMGILNLTPDSFSDGGKQQTLALALEKTAQMVAAGATIIDIGGESTRPGAPVVSAEQELERIMPILPHLLNEFDVFFSLDSSKALVIQAAIDAGIDMINDVRALQDAEALAIVAESGLPVCLMHMQGDPQTMQQAPQYQDVVHDIVAFFQQRIADCIAAGITKQQIILDPGFGFGKSLAHNYQLLANLATFKQFSLPILVGMSRKGMVGQLLQLPVLERVNGNIACAVLAAMQGANIIRVHEVEQTVQAMKIVAATLAYATADQCGKINEY